MRPVIVALATGVLFGAGLTLSGMVHPAKVQAFLDVAGAWDPALAFVMGGALVVSALGWQLARRRKAPLFADRFELPTRRDLDRRLLAGAALFGVGWGLAGLCPGPALTGLAFGVPGAWVFVAAMTAGVGLQRATAGRG